MSKSKRFDMWDRKPVHIAVEGANFMHFLMNRIKDDDKRFGNIYLHDFKAKSLDLGQLDLPRWMRLMQSYSNDRDVVAIGIIRDSEYDYDNMVASTKRTFQETFSVSPQPEEISSTSPALSYLIIPPDSAGCLENTMLDAAPTSIEKECAEVFVECLGDKIKNANHRAKIKVRSMIAAHSPDMWFSHSANSRLWDWEQPSLKMMLDFLQNLNDLA